MVIKRIFFFKVEKSYYAFAQSNFAFAQSFFITKRSHNNFYFGFCNDHANFCVGEHGFSMRTSLWTRRILLRNDYAKCVFWAQKSLFFSVSCKAFLITQTIFLWFLNFLFQRRITWVKNQTFLTPKKHLKSHVIIVIFYKGPKSFLCCAWSVMIFGRFFHFLNHCFT